MSYRTEWADENGHVWVVVMGGGCCWFCACVPGGKKAKKACERNPEA